MGVRFRLLARLSAASIARDRWRWILTALGIATGVSSFAGVLAISRSIIYAFEQSVVRTAGQAQFQISNGTAGVSADLIDIVDRVPDVEASGGNVEYAVFVPALNRRMTVFGILFGADHAYRERQFGAHALHIADAGSFVVQADSVAMSDALLREHGWGEGSRIDVVGPNGPQTLTIRGTVDAAGPLSIYAGDVAVMDSDAAQAAFGELDNFHWIDVVVAPNADLAAMRVALEQAVAGRAMVETPAGRGQRMEAMLGTLRWMLTASGTVAMLVGVFLIQHTVSTAIRRRQADLVTLRAIGATRWLVTLSMLAEAVAIGAIGSIAGVASGVAFAKVAVGAFGDAIGAMYASLPPPPVRMTAREIVASFGIGVGAAFLSALLPSLMLARSRPGAVKLPFAAPEAKSNALPLALGGVGAIAVGMLAARMCGSLGFAGGVSAIAIFVACIFLAATLLVPGLVIVLTPAARSLLHRRWGSPGTWIWQQIERHRYHAATTIGALASAVAFTMGLTTLLGSYRNAFAPWVNQTLAGDVFVMAGTRFSLLSAPAMDAQLMDTIAHVDGVVRVMPCRFVQVQFRNKPIIVQAAASELIERWHAGIPSEHDADDVIISETLAERYKLRVGDALDIPAPLAPLALKVTAVLPDYLLDLGSVTIPWQSFVEHFGAQGPSIAVVDKTPDVASRELKHRIAERLREQDVSVLTVSELREMADTLIDQSFALTTALQLLAVLVTVLAMINATSSVIIDRAYDLATWRAVGMERTRLLQLLVLEACLMGLLAGILGVASGGLVGATLVRMIAPAVTGFRMALEWPLTRAPLLILGTVIFAGATAWSVGRRRMTRPIVLRDRRA